MTIAGAQGPNAPPPRDQRAELRRAAHELEAVFLAQLFRAMRATVPSPGDGDAERATEMFTSMLDDRLAGLAAERMQRGMGEALYRQLSRRLVAGKESP